MSDQDPKPGDEPGARPPEPPSVGQPASPPPYSRPPEYPPPADQPQQYGRPTGDGSTPAYGEPPPFSQSPYPPPPGQAPQYGEAPYGQPHYGQPQYGSPPLYGDPPPPFGAPPPQGQPGYSQTPYNPPPGSPPPGAPGQAPYGAPVTGRPKNYLSMALFATVLGIPGCIGLIPGVAAIIFANRVNRLWDAGDHTAAVFVSQRAKTFATCALVVDVVGLVLGIVLQQFQHR